MRTDTFTEVRGSNPVHVKATVFSLIKMITRFTAGIGMIINTMEMENFKTSRPNNFKNPMILLT